jgi:uncharacterized protein YabN with tetrapyrrole methylase and pyrophosphatase domain
MMIDIHIVGTGMVGHRQLTREAKQVLDSAGEVYLLHPLPEFRDFLDNRCESIINLADDYKQGHDRSRSYKTMAKKVINGAVSADQSVVFAVYGHPNVGVAPTELIREMGEDRGLSIKTLPGVSSFDCLYSDLDFDPFARGLQIFEATDILLYNISLDPATPTFVVQIGLTGTGLYEDRDSESDRFIQLKEHLLQFYPPNHAVSLVRTATHPLADSEQKQFHLNNLEMIADHVDNTHTLFIPPSSERKIENEELAERMYSRKYLDLITE